MHLFKRVSINSRIKEVVVSKFFKERNGAGGGDLQEKYFINEQIKVDKVLVITHTGENLGVVPRSRALLVAQEAGLDLVQVGEKDSVPVTKVMDFGKFLYAKKKQLNDAKKHQKTMQLKEIKLRPNIGDQDYRTKLNQAEQFFVDGKRVKVTLQFKGREIAMIDEMGPKIFARITHDLQEKQVGALVEEKDQRGGAFWSKTYFIKGKAN